MNMLNTIIEGDARELSKDIPDESIDLIFTDPPYHLEYVPLYGWLSQEAARILKPGGFCLAYTGNYWKYQTMQQLGTHLDYFFDYALLLPGDNSILWPRKTIIRHKSILAFVKGQGKPRMNVLSLWTVNAMDKRFHVWGQGESAARYYIECFTRYSETVLDPFVGGGTTPYVCKVLRRNFIGFDLDPEAVETTRNRLELIQPLLIEETPDQLELIG